MNHAKCGGAPVPVSGRTAGSDVVGFDGASEPHRTARPPPGRAEVPGRVSLKFKTLRSSGTLLQAWAAPTTPDAELERGRLRLLLGRVQHAHAHV
ncbi:unnamed protein product [Arctogadus glacialis]